MTAIASNLGRVAVTGASGFIGRHLVDHLRAGDAADVFAWRRPLVDLLDPVSLQEAAKRDRPDTIFHLAAAGVAASRADDIQLIAADLAMTHNLMAATGNGTRIVLAGSMSEYGRAGRLRENDRCTPQTAYGIAKLASGLYASAYAGRRGQAIAIARLFGVYGPGEAPQRLFPSLVGALERRESIEVSDGLQWRDFIHVYDVCAGLCAIAEAVPSGEAVFNLGTGKAVRVRDVIEWILESMGAPASLVRFGARPRSPGDEDLLEADTARYAAMIGDPPPQRLHPGLSKSLFTGV
ncbi:MAG: NAD(P)-dependent oxidoreductase [Flavobacteriaceae bacterium]|nr:NAD(P)-dependent oxidoreductase [Flavobacteriaceae bacterium]